MNLLLLAAALAASPTATLTARDCPTVAKLAEGTMLSRQGGLTLVQLMEMIDERDPLFQPLYREVAFDAFQTLLYHGDDYKIRAAKEFGNKWAMECYRVTVKR